MPRFFIGPPSGDCAVIEGGDARHITRVLRMQPGERIILCDGAGTDYAGVIESAGDTAVSVRILESRRSEAEPTVSLHLYQALPKGEKMDLIIQKAVELGVKDITPVLTSRCVSRPDPQSMGKKLSRYQKIAFEAAKQCGRGVIPAVRPMLGFEQSLAEAANFDLSIFFYECGGAFLQKIISPEKKDIALFVGSEGGFSKEEAALAVASGAVAATLGKRILRCETAPLAALAIIMNLTGNM